MVMKVKQLEIVGFKSFADKTVLRLHDGVTCIVGPNGCGKSNVVDAFKWVLGEQSVKSLRGEKMEEVIFQGSATVKQKGMAEVNLQISLPGKQDPDSNGHAADSAGDRDSTFVSRRLYRSGESEYLINKSQCRLMDIRNIFLDTGLDVKSYSILDQGRVTDLINAKPQDRRFLIDEIAGVMKYKTRKTEALSKLESSKQNLQRINDIVHEKRRQINSLDRQVKRAERHKRLNAELKCIELRFAKREYLRLSGILQELSAEIEKLREADSLKRGTLSTIENLIETKRLEMAGKEKALAELESLFYVKEKEIAESDKQSAILKSAIENRRADIERLSAHQRELDYKKEDLQRKFSGIDTSADALSADMAVMADELSEKRELLSSFESSLGDKELLIEEKRKELFSISEIVSQKRNDLYKLQASSGTLQYRESASSKEFETVRSGIAAAEESISGALENIAVIKGRLESIHSEKEILRDETEKLNREMESQKNLLASEREALASNMARLNSLKEMAFDKSLMDVLLEAVAVARHPANAGEYPSGLSADCLVLSDGISTEREYERAIEAALSDKINSILLRSIEDVLAAVSVIKERNLGRTALLYPGFTGNGQAPEFDAQSTTLDGIIGMASHFINVENREMKGLAGMILENTLIVRDLQSAIAFRKQKTSNFALVTLEGEVIDRDGVILAGQGKDILKRKREIKELHATILEQQSLITVYENDLSIGVGTLSDKKESLITIEGILVDIEKELSVADHSLKGLRDENESKRRKLAILSSEIAEITEEKESLKALIASKSDEIGLSEKERDIINESITELQDSIGTVRTEYETAKSEVTELQIIMTSHREKIQALQREKINISVALRELEKTRETAVREAGEAEKRILESASKVERYEEILKDLVVEAAAISREKTIQKEAIEVENQVLVTESNSLKSIRIEIDALSQQLSETNSAAIEHRFRAETIENDIANKYGIDIKHEEVTIEGFDLTEDKEQMNQFNQKIRDLGPVNPGTIEEFEELKNHYDFLTRQQQDLILSIAELEEAISRINASTRRKLREAFDALKAKFAEVFRALFEGGKADMILTDEGNILESGIEIIAQLPGKKLQNLNLLSGGEKALTSLSLLFAGFLIKPSPLCILDEVDAPLDESNTVRFAQMVKGLSKDTQFIVITHNRATMEVADYLYGVTMEDKGVSKAISL